MSIREIFQKQKNKFVKFHTFIWKEKNVDTMGKKNTLRFVRCFPGRGLGCVVGGLSGNAQTNSSQASADWNVYIAYFLLFVTNVWPCECRQNTIVLPNLMLLVCSWLSY